MRKQVIFEFTEEDVNRIRATKSDPCLKCRVGVECCGCPTKREWDNIHGKLDSDAKEFANAYCVVNKQLNCMYDSLRTITEQLDKLKFVALPDGSTPLFDEGFTALNNLSNRLLSRIESEVCDTHKEVSEESVSSETALEALNKVQEAE